MNLKEMIDKDFPDFNASNKLIRQYIWAKKRDARTQVRITTRRVWIPTEYEQYRKSFISKNF